MTDLTQAQFVHQILLNGDHTHEVLDGAEDIDIGKTQTVWLHIDLSEPEALAWLESEAGLEIAAVNALTAEENRPRSFKGKHGLMLVLRGVNLNPGHDPEDMVSIRVWIESNRIISVRRRPLVSINDIVEDLENGDGPRTSGEFLTELVDKLANRIGEFVSTIDDELSNAEEHLEEMAPAELRSTLGSLRRQIATVRRYLAPQRDALDRLNHLDTQLLSERDRMRLREESDRVSRYLEDLDLARERAVVLQEAFLSQIAQQQNSRMYVLSIVTAVFLPLGFITGLLGINVGGMPGADNPLAFWIVLGMLGALAVAIVLAFRRMRWM